MHSRRQIAWGAVRDSLWFIPALFTMASLALALVLLHLERNGQLGSWGREHILLGGGADGASAVLTALATGLMTVTGVVFSVTVVALQLASTQFTPRVLRNFMADRANQIVLGVLIGSFTYSMLVLRMVESGDNEFVPRVSVGVAMLLGLICVALLIYYINHTARSIQISMILKRAGDRGLAQVDGLFPEDFGTEDPISKEEAELPDEHACVRSARSGYVQAIDAASVFDAGRKAETIVRIEHRIGSYVLKGEPLARVWPPGRVTDRFEDELRDAFVLGPERTPDQDYELVLVEVSDIAVKALSPGINDPTTAQHCIDQLSELLLALARRHAPTKIRTEDGRLHVVVKDLPFEVALDSSFSPIIHFGASNPAVRSRLLERLKTLSELVPEDRRKAVLDMREVVVAIRPRLVS